jgi:hypothetical protein
MSRRATSKAGPNTNNAGFKRIRAAWTLISVMEIEVQAALYLLLGTIATSSQDSAFRRYANQNKYRGLLYGKEQERF